MLLRLNFEGGTSESGIYKYHVDFGPTISYWLGGRGRVGDEFFKKYKIVFNKDTANVDLSSNLLITGANRLQWGLNLGFGVEYPVIKNQNVYLDLRFFFGHSNLTESEGYSDFNLLGYEDALNVRFHQLILTASYMFTYDWRLRRKGKSTQDRGKRR